MILVLVPFQAVTAGLTSVQAVSRDQEPSWASLMSLAPSLAMIASPGPILSHNFDSGPILGHELVPSLIQGSNSSPGSHVYPAPAWSLALLCPSQSVTLGPA